MLRGINLQNIFVTDEDNEKFISILEKYKKEIAYEIYAYCLMGNHVHLLMKEGNEEISNTMKRIGVSYVHWYNWQYDRKGHLFQGRFKSEPVGDDGYFLTVLRYIHQNPVKAGFVKDIKKYKWSSYNEYAKLSKLVNTDFALGILAVGNKKPIDAFCDYHRGVNDDQCLDIEAKRKTLSDSEVRQLALDEYGVELAKLHNLGQKSQDEILKNLKEEKGISLRQLSRLTGFTVYRIRVA